MIGTASLYCIIPYKEMEYSSVHEGWQNRSVELIRLIIK